MEFEIDFTKTAQENANYYYEKAKEARKKREGAEEAIKRMEKALSAHAAITDNAHKPKVAREREWYEKFHWFFASDGRLAIGGRSAQQNELLNSKYFGPNDLFFHADIFGASVVIFKEGKDAERSVKEEVADFAACYSSAWKDMVGSVDVYCLGRENVGKSTNNGYIATGSFVMKGEREWFRHATLKLVAYASNATVKMVPESTFNKVKPIGKSVLIEIGKDKKSDAAKAIASYLECDDIDEIMQKLPAGSFHLEFRE